MRELQETFVAQLSEYSKVAAESEERAKAAEEALYSARSRAEAMREAALLKLEKCFDFGKMGGGRNAPMEIVLGEAVDQHRKLGAKVS